MYLEKLCVFFERPPYCLREMKQIIIVQHVQTPDPDMHACFVAWNWKKEKKKKDTNKIERLTIGWDI